MKILGIDYGRSKVGLAISESGLAEPLKVIRYKDIDLLNGQIDEIIKLKKIDQIVVGISEGEMEKESSDFALELARLFPAVSIDLFDETLTSHDARNMSIQAGVRKKKRHEMEDAFAATIILQNYLDSKGS